MYVVPANDGEAIRAHEILQAVGASHVYQSKQKWGATLDKEMPALLAKLAEQTHRSVKNICLFELPGQKQNAQGKIYYEEALRQQGYELEIIDHHYYDWVDRQHELSSLEQLCAKINWQMSEDDYHIAVNDRSYIPALLALRLSRTRIRQIRCFDLRAQGWQENAIAMQIEKANNHIEENKVKKRANLYLLAEQNASFIIQELTLRHNTLNALTYRTHSLNFTGAPQIVDMLFSLDFSLLGCNPPFRIYGGGDRRHLKFFGLKAKASISAACQQKILSYILTYLETYLEKN